MPHTQRSKSLLTVLLGSVFAVVALSGCLGNDAGEPSNKAPNAALSVDREERWTNETFTFHAQESTDPDGEIASWRYDFGDGTVMEYTTEDEGTEVDHTYLRGGEFIVTLTVTDDGAQNAGAKTDTAEVEIRVDEENQYISPALYAAPVNGTTPAEHKEEFRAYEGVDGVEWDLNVESTQPFGQSEILFQILDDSEQILDEKTVNVEAGEDEAILLKDVVDQPGNYTLLMRTESGGAIAEGEYRVYYTGFQELVDTQT